MYNFGQENPVRKEHFHSSTSEVLPGKTLSLKVVTKPDS